MALHGTYRVSFNANHGAGAPGDITGTTDWVDSGEYFFAIFNLPSTKPSRTYYTFLGWSKNSGATSAAYSAGGSMSVQSPSASITVTLYAVWKVNTAYVYYNANGGSGAPATQSHWAGYSVTLSATTPTRSGYNFKGWATSPTATVKQYDPNTTYALYTTVTLYAVWERAASTLTASNGTMGTAMTIGITRYVNTYTDTITYQFGSATGTIVTKTNNASVSWTPPTTLASQIPNSASGTCTFTCTTYSGNTVIGTSTKTITLSVPNSLAPTVSVSYADTNATCLAWGVLVQSRSTLAFSITASGQESATIASYSTTVNGTTYNSATFTTDVLLYNGTNTYSVTVTDSRGKQTTSTGTFSVVAYSVPSITLTLCDRDDADDEQINVEFGFSVASVSNNNDANYRIDYKLKSSAVWTNGTVTSLGGYSGTITDAVTGRDGGDEWDIRINVIDSFQTTSITSEVGVSGNILLNSRHQGGLGILMKSQAQNQLDVGKKSVFHEAVKEMYGSTVGNHAVSGNYAKVLTFSTDVQVGKNLLNDVDPDVKNAYITGANKLGASPINRVVIIPINQNTYYTFTWNRVAIPGAGSDDTNVLLFSEYPVIGTTVGESTGVNMSSNPAVRTFNSGSNIYAAIKIANTDKTTYQDTLSASQLELGQSSTPHEAYVNPSNINVNAPITIEYAKTGDTSPTTLTIVFNRDYTLQSFTKNTSADAYLHNLATATWDLYIGKSTSSDSVEILDFHNPWSNSDMTITWGNTSISTLPTGYVEATLASIPNTYGDLLGTGQHLYVAPSENINLTSGAYKTTASVTLTKGVWLLMGTVQFNANSTGNRTAYFATSSDSSTDMGAVYKDLRSATNGGQSYCRITAYYENTSTSTTLYLVATQNSGSTISTSGRIMAVKIS